VNSMLQKPDPDKIVFKVFPEALKKLNDGHCTSCDKLIEESDFRDESSKVEYSISGLCQQCQDEVFGE